jgi:hypothetical protein
MALSYGEPATLSAAELDEVTAEARRRRYGERRGGSRTGQPRGGSRRGQPRGGSRTGQPRGPA